MFDILFILRIIILLVACIISAYTDYKSGYVYNWLSYSLILIGLVFNIFTYSLISLINIILVGVAIYLIGYVFYYFGKVGGGDIKLFIGIHLIFPYFLGQLFILWVLIFSSLISVLFVSVYYLFILFRKIKDLKKILLKKKKKILKSAIFFLVFVFMISFSISYSLLSSLFYLFLIPIFFGLVVLIFEKEVKRYIYVKKKAVSMLEDGDVLAEEFLSKNLKEKLEKIGLKKRSVLEEEDFKELKKLKLKTLPIYDNLPKFAPYILAAVIVILLFGKHFVF